jgi:CRISPR-associated protein Cmr3
MTTVVTLHLTARDPVVARDGRPFGAGQGNRMRGLGWPLPSVVAGSFRTALVKADPTLDFAGDMPQRLMKIEVAGVFPVVGNELYLPAPNDCVWNGETGVKHAAKPIELEGGGCDFPIDGLRPVLFSDDAKKPDFKPKPVPAWWPVGKLTEWLLGKGVTFDDTFLNAAIQETRDHVRLDAGTGAAAEGELFTTAGLNLKHLPRFGVHSDDEKLSFDKRFAEIGLSARVAWDGQHFAHLKDLATWHPLGGERRLVHWQRSDAGNLWECPAEVKAKLGTAAHVRMVLVTPAVFKKGWKPGWLSEGLEGTPPGTSVRLRLVGVSSGRWKAVSGWSLAKINSRGELDPNGKPGPKPIRRMVPAGSVYFFEVTSGEAAALAEHSWLKSISDDEQEQHDGFGLAVWGTW